LGNSQRQKKSASDGCVARSIALRMSRIALATVTVASILSLGENAQAQNARRPVGSKTAAKPLAKAAAKSVAKPVAKPAARVANPAPTAKQRAVSQGKPTVLPEKKPREVASQSGGESGAEGATALSKFARTVRASDPDTGVHLADITALSIGDSYLLLPLEFVSDAALARNQVRFFLDDAAGKVSQEIFLSELDLDAGLALFKTTSKLSPSLAMGRVSESPPQMKDSFTAVSAINVARPGARFLKARQDVATTHYLFAMAGSSPAAQANYIFDRDGELVGVTSGHEKNGAAWAASGRSIAALIRRATTSPAPASVVGLEPRRRQLVSWQDRWTQALNPSKKGIITRFLDCRTHHATISDEKVAAQVHRFDAKACDSRFSLPLGAGYEAGIQMQIGEAFIKPSTQFERNRDQTLATISQAFAAPLFNDLSRSVASVNLMTSSECRDSQATNQTGQRVAVRFCTSALKGESGLNDTSISVASLDPTWRGAGAHAFIAAVRLKGFGQMQTRRILEAMIENPQEAK
jgi:hypothetical protein